MRGTTRSGLCGGLLRDFKQDKSVDTYQIAHREALESDSVSHCASGTVPDGVLAGIYSNFDKINLIVFCII